MRSWISQQFWSLYGRLAWDINRPVARRELINRVVAEVQRETKAPVQISILDAGCGTGDFSLACAQAGMRVTAIDSAPGMLTCARSKLSQFTLASIQKLDLSEPLPFNDQTFDYVFLISVLHLCASPTAVLAETLRVLKPSGAVLVFHAHTPRDLSAFAVARQKSSICPRRLVPFAMLWLKTWLEQLCITPTWSRNQLVALLEAQGFIVDRISPEAPFLAFARRPSNSPFDAYPEIAADTRR